VSAAGDGRSFARVLVTGGAGFVGTNLAARLAGRGIEVRLLDSLARAGSEENVRWLTQRFGCRVELVRGDIRDARAVEAAVDSVDHVFHLAAQVAVTTSLTDPVADFEVNARGTLNLLEAARSRSRPPSVVFASTNKVYGALQDVKLRASGARYEPVDEHLRTKGVDETRPLEFHSPYGCSKGAAEQYVLDYARSFGLRTVVLRMSCIYGPHQHGNEDQGWVAHFMIRALDDEPVTIYGDGMQVRDILFVGDLLDAFESAWRNVDTLAGRAFNIGGGVGNTLSLLELLERIEAMTHRAVPVSFERWRTGDQRYYVTDSSSFTRATGWSPRTGVDVGLAALAEWLQERSDEDGAPRGAACREERMPAGMQS
jgi:CDP-paratose 2-epimerase